MALGYELKKYLLTHLVRNTYVLDKFFMILAPEDFSGVSEKPFQIIWHYVKEWYTAELELIDKAVLGNMIGKAIANDPELASSPESIQEVYKIIDEIFATEESCFKVESTNNYVIKELQEFVYERQLKPIAQQAVDASGDILNQLIESIETKREAAQVSTFSEVDMMTAGRGMTSVKFRSGFKPFDDATGGGIAPGDVIGLVGPSGGGKSALSVQIAVEYAKLGMNVLYLPYEMDVVPEYFRRVIGYACGFDADYMRNKTNIDDFPEKDKEFVSETWRKLSKNLKFTNMIGKHGGVSEMNAILRELDTKDWHVDLVVVDQYFHLLQNYMSIMGKSSDSLRGESQAMCAKITVMASARRCSVLLLHQMEAAKKALSPTRVPKQGETADDKGFDSWIQYCVVIGVSDENKVAWFVNTKARSAGDVKRIVQIVGEKYMVRDVSEIYETDGPDFVRRPQRNVSVAQSMPQDINMDNWNNAK